MRFKNKTALITGAAVGIGRATAVKLAQQGANVVALDLNSDELKLLKKEGETIGGKILTYVCDVSNELAVNLTIEDAKKQFGKIDILVNNAALWRTMSSFLETSVETWKNYIDVNVMSAVYCTKSVLPEMIENGCGRIINVASVAGVYGNANMVHYSATKGALIAMTQALAKEVANKGVLVNAISPGTVSSFEIGRAHV